MTLLRNHVLPGFLSLAAIIIAACGGNPTYLAVPALFALDPAGSTQAVDWSRIEKAGSNVHIVVAEASFKGLSDSGLVHARAQFSRLRAESLVVLGYVSTKNGHRASSSVTADVDAWFSKYPSQIDGIYFDEGPSFDAWTRGVLDIDTILRLYYTAITNYVRTNGPQPTQPKILLNASGFPNKWVLKVADYVIVWENCKEAYMDPAKYGAINAKGAFVPPPAWWSDPYNRYAIAHTIWNVPASDMPNIIALSKDRGAGLVYVYSGTSAAYSSLPAYFEQELAAALQTSWKPGTTAAGQCPKP
jgi:hypothetical protein